MPAARRSIRSREETVEQPRRRGLVPQLDHVHNPRPGALVAQLDRHARPSDSFHSIAQDDGGDEEVLFVVIRLDDELFQLGSLLFEELELGRAQGLPLCVLLLQEDFALHLSGDDGRTGDRGHGVVVHWGGGG